MMPTVDLSGTAGWFGATATGPAGKMIGQPVCEIELRLAVSVARANDNAAIKVSDTIATRTKATETFALIISPKTSLGSARSIARDNYIQMPTARHTSSSMTGPQLVG
jgi:hypothetical protein